MLTTCPASYIFFLEERHKRELNPKSPRKGMIARCFAKLIEDLYASQSKSVSPVQFKKACAHFAPHLLDYQQQDSQEFCRFLLGGLAEDLQRPAPPTGPGPETGEKEEPHEREASNQQEVQSQNQSSISRSMSEKSPKRLGTLLPQLPRAAGSSPDVLAIEKASYPTS